MRWRAIHWLRNLSKKTTYPIPVCRIIIQKYIQSSIQPSKRNRENDMSLLQDERLVSSRLEKSEQIVNAKKSETIATDNIQDYEFFCHFNGLLQNIAYFKIRFSQLFL